MHEEAPTNNYGQGFFKYDIIKFNDVIYKIRVAVSLEVKSKIHVLWDEDVSLGE
jgi:hypothetical protein